MSPTPGHCQVLDSRLGVLETLLVPTKKPFAKILTASFMSLNNMSFYHYVFLMVVDKPSEPQLKLVRIDHHFGCNFGILPSSGRRVCLIVKKRLRTIYLSTNWKKAMLLTFSWWIDTLFRFQHTFVNLTNCSYSVNLKAYLMIVSANCKSNEQFKGRGVAVQNCTELFRVEVQNCHHKLEFFTLTGPVPDQTPCSHE